VNFVNILLVTVMLGFGLSCSQSKTSPDIDCTYAQELALIDDFAKSGSIFLFGERHGTAEAPSFVANFACKIAKDTQEPIIVLLELAIPEVLSDLSRYPMSISQAQTAILEGDPHWAGGHDGRTSVAMMEAIRKILEMREQGLNIALGSIYPDERSQSKFEDLGLSFANETTYVNRYFQEAAQILRYKDKYSNVIVLSGKNHTRNHLRFFKKMELDTSYLGFVQASGGGTEWNCQPQAGGCKIHSSDMSRRHLVNEVDDVSLVLLNENAEVFHGAFTFKTTSASPPFLKENTE